MLTDSDTILAQRMQLENFLNKIKESGEREDEGNNLIEFAEREGENRLNDTDNNFDNRS